MGLSSSASVAGPALSFLLVADMQSFAMLLEQCIKQVTSLQTQVDIQSSRRCSTGNQQSWSAQHTPHSMQPAVRTAHNQQHTTQPSVQNHQCTIISTQPSVQKQQHTQQHTQHRTISTKPAAHNHQYTTISTAQNKEKAVSVCSRSRETSRDQEPARHGMTSGWF